MSRPYKQGVDYFSLDCHLDDKWQFIEAQFGLTGFSVVVKLLQKIYGERGYYCEWDSRVALLFSRGIGLAGGNVVQEVVAAALNEGIFDNGMFQKYHILTSRGIQKRYAQAAGKRENFEIDCRYSLLNCTHSGIINAENRVSDRENPVSDAGNTQIKSNKIKLNTLSSREYKRARAKAPTLEEIEAYCQERKNNVPAQRFYDTYSAVGWRDHGSPIVDWRAKVRCWESYEEGQRKKEGMSFDVSQAFEAALKRTYGEEL